jgi:hypothetical protein
LNSLGGYAAELQGDWDEVTSTLTFGYNCRVHASIGLAPFELVLSRPPPSLSVETPEKGTPDTPETAKLRFLHLLAELFPLATRRLAESQARYKRWFDRGVRDKNKEVRAGAWVFLRKELHQVGVNPKLDEQVEGPYLVIATDGRTFLLRIKDDEVRVSSDRVTPAPTPVGESLRESCEEGDRQDSTRTEAQEEGTEENEYVFERIVGTREAPDGTLLYRIRWYGYSR